MSNYLTLVRAVYSGISQRQVAKSYQVSRNTIALALQHAQKRGWLTLASLASISEEEFCCDFHLAKPPARDLSYAWPDYNWVHQELSKPYVTLKLLWEEYVAQCVQSGKRYYMETQFRQHYHEYAQQFKSTIRLEHKPGLALEVDWAGTKIKYFDQEKVTWSEASLFISVLPCSQLIYAEPFPDQSLSSWISGHVHGFQYFNGVPKTIIPDNLKTGVKQSNFYQPVITKAYQEMADYYQTIILPARVRKPKDKPSVENGVLISSRKILAKLRNKQILSFSNLQELISAALEEINQSPLTGKNESRWSSYLAEEKDYLLSLPARSYELAEWSQAKVQPNCHIAFQHKFYSVPFEYLGKEVDIRSTSSTVEILYQHERIASHKRLWGKVTYSTVKEHMPPAKTFFTDWNGERFLEWAKKCGPETQAVVQAILDSAAIEQQAYRSCFGLLALREEYGELRLERACHLALQRSPQPTYRHVKSILKRNENQFSKETEIQPPALKKTTGFRRGANYFAREEKDPC